MQSLRMSPLPTYSSTTAQHSTTQYKNEMGRQTGGTCELYESKQCYTCCIGVALNGKLAAYIAASQIATFCNSLAWFIEKVRLWTWGNPTTPRACSH